MNINNELKDEHSLTYSHEEDIRYVIAIICQLSHFIWYVPLCSVREKVLYLQLGKDFWNVIRFMYLLTYRYRKCRIFVPNRDCMYDSVPKLEVFTLYASFIVESDCLPLSCKFICSDCCHSIEIFSRALISEGIQKGWN